MGERLCPHSIRSGQPGGRHHVHQRRQSGLPGGRSPTKAVDKTKEIIKEKNADASEADVDEIAKAVGIGAVIFQELSNNRIKDYTFKWDKVLNFDGERGPYVQYTHARCASVLRKAGEAIVKKAAALEGRGLSISLQ